MIDIKIERKLPIINGFVQVPDLQRTRRNSLVTDDAKVLIDGSSTVRIGSSKLVHREWYVLPEFDRLEGPPSDFFQTLRNAVI